MNAPDLLEKAAWQRLAELEKNRLRRELSPIPQGFADFSSNDYLGLKTHPAITEAAMSWVSRFGAGSGASRLAGGTREEYVCVEEKLAHFKGREAALVFNSGFQLNATVIPVLADLLSPGIFSDRLIHASLHHGIAASGHPQMRFRHNDLNHLEDLLRKDQAKHKLIITESVFSMDGDYAPLEEMQSLAARYHAILYIDEAHATGVLGKEGRGLATGLSNENIIIMGTLGKALGGFGAYLTGGRHFIQYILNRAAGFIYSTALPPSCYGILDKALDIVPGMDEERHRLKQRAHVLREELKSKAINVGLSQTQIVPAILGSEEKTLKARDLLAAQALYVPAIRPPTVPKNGSRLRISLNASQPDATFQKLLTTIADL